MRFITILLLLSSSCFAQLDLSYSKRKTLTGVTSPQIVGDDIVVGDDSGTPTIVNGAEIRTRSMYTFIELEVLLNGEEIDLGDPVELKKEVDGKTEITSKWVAKGEGKYKVTARAVDVNLGFKKSKIEFIIGALPRPVDPVVDPVLPPVPDNLSPLAKAARSAAIAYVQSMGSDYDKLSNHNFIKVVNGSQLMGTVMDASVIANSYDKVTRDKFKSDMGSIMSQQLGNNILPNNHKQIFGEIALGFKGVK